MPVNNVRAKFRCTSIKPYTHRTDDGGEMPAASLTFIAVFARAEDGSGQACLENQIFGKWTPSGELNMGVIGAASQCFELGKEYYLDLSPAPDTPLRDFPAVAGIDYGTTQG